jgi:2-polyprenyl-3-methyl-5-hydroxy-6-metoxy-1,4-benzoquinol methylase
MAAHPIVKPLRIVLRQLARPWRALRRPKGTHQVKNSTSYDRYPGIFASVRDYVERHRERPPKLLSFGCSTGEECFALRNLYFPGAVIYGAEIDKRNLAACRAANSDPEIHFIQSSNEQLQEHAPYDVIFAMSVLCRWPETQNIRDASAVYPVTVFDEVCRDLDALLAPGGLLVLYNTNFRFADSPLASNYRVLKDARVPESGFVHKFDRQNRKLEDQASDEVIFIKAEA